MMIPENHEWEDAWECVDALRRDGRDLVVVTVTAERGSTPAELGAKAVVTSGGRVCGTLGGGKVEAKAVEEAREMLGGTELCRTRVWNLRQDVGMTCGGEV